MTDKELKNLKGWALEKEAMFEEKYNKNHSIVSLDTAKKYELVVKLCDLVMEKKC
jgi:hypothetical protein